MTGAAALPIRVLVVEDSRVMQVMLAGILSSDPGIQVVAAAGDGEEAVEAVELFRPDVVTMDLAMPRVDGLTALGHIMAVRPTPVVVVSAYAGPGSREAQLALALGAVDVVAKPAGSVDLGLEGLRDEILRKVRTAARVRPVRTAGPPPGPHPAPPGGRLRRPGGREPVACVVLAASTGGPAALLEVVPRLPGRLPAALLVVQHMPARYTGALARELASRSPLAVREAAAGDRLESGVAYVAPGDHHLVVGPAGRIALEGARAADGHCPSADRAMASVARWTGARAVGVILTGMGRDGAEGARAIRQAGGIVLAQDEASSVVFGMAQAAAALGAVDRVLPLGELPAGIVQAVERVVRGAGDGRR